MRGKGGRGYILVNEHMYFPICLFDYRNEVQDRGFIGYVAFNPTAQKDDYSSKSNMKEGTYGITSPFTLSSPFNVLATFSKTSLRRPVMYTLAPLVARPFAICIHNESLIFITVSWTGCTP